MGYKFFLQDGFSFQIVEIDLCNKIKNHNWKLIVYYFKMVKMNIYKELSGI
ncbi:hypothetical protein HOC37_04730 [bacterium]|nr:hypothetical protein [bacterium]